MAVSKFSLMHAVCITSIRSKNQTIQKVFMTISIMIVCVQNFKLKSTITILETT